MLAVNDIPDELLYLAIYLLVGAVVLLNGGGTSKYFHRDTPKGRKFLKSSFIFCTLMWPFIMARRDVTWR